MCDWKKNYPKNGQTEGEPDMKAQPRMTEAVDTLEAEQLAHYEHQAWRYRRVNDNIGQALELLKDALHKSCAVRLEPGFTYVECPGNPGTLFAVGEADGLTVVANGERLLVYEKQLVQAISTLEAIEDWAPVL
jgi:hypothetical protein